MQHNRPLHEQRPSASENDRRYNGLTNKPACQSIRASASPAFSVLAALITLLPMLVSGGAALAADDFNNRVVLTDQRGAYPLGQQLAILEDPTKSLGIEDVTSSPYADQFIPSTKSVPGFGFSPSAYWVRVALDRQTTREEIWVLEFGYAPMQWIDVYTRPKDGEFQHQRGGLGVPYSERPYPHHKHVFELDLPAGQTTELWLRVNGESSKNIPLQLYRADRFAQTSSQELAMLSLYAGILIALFCYNLFIYATLRNPSYLFYVGFLVMFLLFSMSLNGLAQILLTPNNPWLGLRLIPFSMGGVGLFGTLFTMRFLDTRTDLPRWHWLLCGAVIWALVACVLPLVASYRVSILVSTSLALAFCVSCLAVGVLAVIHGNRAARYFLLAWTLLLLGIVIYVLKTFGLLPANLFTEYTMLWGSAAEAILLSVALAARMRLMKEEKEAAQQAALENQQLALDNLRRADQLKGEFMANMSHELRTPMNAIIGYSEILREEARDDGQTQYEPDLNKILAASRHLLGLINDVLDLTKIESGKIELYPEPVEVGPLITELEATVAPLLQKNHNQLITTIADARCTILTDKTRLSQILLNLLSNAAKFTEQGQIHLTVTTEVKADGEWAVFKVVDTGIGIKEAQLDAIFEAFTQADASTTRNYGGTGLGLTISKHFCEMLGGTLSVTTREGEGSTFTLRLPSSTEEAPSAA